MTDDEFDDGGFDTVEEDTDAVTSASYMAVDF